MLERQVSFADAVYSLRDSDRCIFVCGKNATLLRYEASSVSHTTMPSFGLGCPKHTTCSAQGSWL